jgi:DNA-binding response OmpR family regulator
MLIFDRDSSRREELASYFKAEDFRVTVCDEEAEFRRILDGETVDLVLLDLAAPGESGFELAGELGHRQGIGVILLGNRDDVIDRVVGLEVGADDFMSRPFVMRELLARVHSVLRRCGREYFDPHAGTDDPESSGETLAFAGWRVDIEHRRLRSPGGEDIDISPGEFDILMALIENAGRPVSRAELGHRGTGSEADPDGRSVDVLIGRLRQKIEPNPRNPSIIKTARGIGYMLDEAVKPA